jgi:hypothetical protein
METVQAFLPAGERLCQGRPRQTCQPRQRFPTSPQGSPTPKTFRLCRRVWRRWHKQGGGPALTRLSAGWRGVVRVCAWLMGVPRRPGVCRAGACLLLRAPWRTSTSPGAACPQRARGAGVAWSGPSRQRLAHRDLRVVHAEHALFFLTSDAPRASDRRTLSWSLRVETSSPLSRRSALYAPHAQKV